jgi:hypothetical protein
VAIEVLPFPLFIGNTGKRVHEDTYTASHRIGSVVIEAVTANENLRILQAASGTQASISRSRQNAGRWSSWTLVADMTEIRFRLISQRAWYHQKRQQLSFSVLGAE